MRIMVVPTSDGAGLLQTLTDGDEPAGPPVRTDDLGAAIEQEERRGHPRWIWADTQRSYPALVERGLRVERSYDLTLAEATLLGYAGRWGEPASLAAAWARCHGEQPPELRAVHTAGAAQQELFTDADDGLPGGVDPLAVALTVYTDQRRRLAAALPDRTAYEPMPVTARQLDLLIAGDSAGALAAAEMSHAGLPWDGDVHDRLLVEALGPRPQHGGRPAKLQALAAEIAAALDTPRLNPDSPAEVLRAFGDAGISVESTRAHVLRRVDHPAVAPLLAYKGLARLHTANGWAWRDTWVRDRRFRPEYVAAAVVSGRWATRGGGALQIPKAVRGAVVADPGWVLVVADAQQLEPRILAALSGDGGMTRAADHGDLYAALAQQSFAGDRAQAKVGLLSAMYGGSSAALATLRRSYPRALALLEDAARAGESGRLVRSVLGRTCPRPRWDDLSEAQVLQRARERGRFTRNFVIQASAADWAAALIALLRSRLATFTGRPELVFFQHDEVIVHCREADARDVVTAVTAAAEHATGIILGSTQVRLPLTTAVVADYGAAK